MESFYFTIYGLVFLILLIIIYFPKKKIKLLENSIYSILIIATLICSLTEVIAFILVKNNIPSNSLLYLYTLKILFLGFLSWLYFFSLYVIITSVKNNENENKLKKIINKSLYGFGIISLLIVFLPIIITNKNGMLLPSGPAVNLLYIIAFICIIMMLFTFFKNVKKYKDKKYVPLYLLIILFSFVIVIQNIFPSLLLINPSFVLITFVMYFTIENPDVKMNTELAKNRNLIQNAMEEKNNFLFIVSTSLRNTINNLNELSLNVIKKDSKGLFKEDLLEINNEIKYLSFTINDVLNVSTMDINEIKIIENKYNLKKLIEKIKLVNKAKVNDNLNFRVEFSSSLPDYFYGDKTLLSLVITSLLNNAFKYTETGFVELRINGIVKYDMCRLIITIEDSGCGISISEINELLTDKNITKKELERLDTNDLNINLIKKIIKKMGGYFIIKSKVGFGTEVKFVLDQKIIGHNDNNNIIINNNKVLVATSDINLFKIINKYLENNYLVEKSLYEQDIIDKIKNKQEYKYILIDDNLDTRALPILNKIKTLNNKIPIIVILDKDTSVIKKQFLKDGFSDYILRSNIESDIKKLL